MTGVDPNGFMNEMLPTIKMKTPKQKIKELEEEIGKLKKKDKYFTRKDFKESKEFSKREIEKIAEDNLFYNRELQGLQLKLQAYKEAISDIRALIEDFKNILKNNKNPEFKEYNELLLNDIDEILKEIEGEEK